MVATVRFCLANVARRGPRRFYACTSYLKECVPIFFHDSLTCLYLAKKSKFEVRIWQSHRRFSTDREEILDLLRGAGKDSTASAEEKKEDEMFSDLPGSLSDYDSKWRLNTSEYTGSSVSDHDNWVRDRSNHLQLCMPCRSDFFVHTIHQQIASLRRSAATPNPVLQMEQKLFGALGEQKNPMLRVSMGEQVSIQVAVTAAV